MPFTYNDKHDLQEEERRHQESRLAKTLTRIASQILNHNIKEGIQIMLEIRYQEEEENKQNARIREIKERVEKINRLD